MARSDNSEVCRRTPHRTPSHSTRATRRTAIDCKINSVKHTNEDVLLAHGDFNRVGALKRPLRRTPPECSGRVLPHDRRRWSRLCCGGASAAGVAHAARLAARRPSRADATPTLHDRVCINKRPQLSTLDSRNVRVVRQAPARAQLVEHTIALLLATDGYSYIQYI